MNISVETVFLSILSYFFMNIFPGIRSYSHRFASPREFYKRKACHFCAVFLHERHILISGKHIPIVQYSYLESIPVVCSIPNWKACSLFAAFLSRKYIHCVQYSYSGKHIPCVQYFDLESIILVYNISIWKAYS